MTGDKAVAMAFRSDGVRTCEMSDLIWSMPLQKLNVPEAEI